MNANEPQQNELNQASIEDDLSNVKNSNINKFLRINELSELTTLSKSCINLWVAQGKFLSPIVLSPTVKVWALKDVLEWMDLQKKHN
jgi:predicted DNA-binding transcriptional regulator AlpA